MIDENPYASPQAESLGLSPEDALVEFGESLVASYQVDKRLLKRAANRYLNTSLAEGIGALAFFACLGLGVIFATTFRSIHHVVIGYAGGAILGLTFRGVFHQRQLRRFLAEMRMKTRISEPDSFQLELTDKTLILQTKKSRHEWILSKTTVLPNPGSFATIVADDSVVIPIPRRADLGGIPLPLFLQVLERRREKLKPKPDAAWRQLGRFFANLWSTKPADRHG